MAEWCQVKGDYPYYEGWKDSYDVGYNPKYVHDKTIFEYELWYQVRGDYPYKLMWKEIPLDPPEPQYGNFKVVLKNCEINVVNNAEYVCTIVLNDYCNTIEVG